MTRDEAIEKLDAVEGRRKVRGYSAQQEFIEALVDLGLLKLDEPKSIEDQAHEAICGITCNIEATGVIDRLRARGFEIVKRGEPKRAHEQAYEVLKKQFEGHVLSRHVAEIVDALNANGFKIVKA